MASLSPYIYFHLSRYKMVKIHLALPYEKRLLPFLLEPLGPPDELWMMGQSGDCATVHPQLAHFRNSRFGLDHFGDSRFGLAHFMNS